MLCSCTDMATVGVKGINIEYCTNIDTYIGNFIERCVAAKTKVGAGNIVTNRCRDSYYRYAELWVVRPRLREHYNTVKRLQKNQSDKTSNVLNNMFSSHRCRME